MNLRINYWNISEPGGETIGRKGQTPPKTRMEVFNMGGGRHRHPGYMRYYYLKDHLGSIRVTLNQHGAVAGYDDYYPFGLQMPGRSNNSANRDDDQKFTGHFLEQEGGLGIYHAQARMYDPAIGRFLGVDAMRSEMPGWNPYHYTFNNPVRYVDLDGNMPECPNCSVEQHNAIRNASYNEALTEVKGAFNLMKVKAFEFFSNLGGAGVTIDTDGQWNVSYGSHHIRNSVNQDGEVSESFDRIDNSKVTVPTKYVDVELGADFPNETVSVGLSKRIGKLFKTGVRAIIPYGENSRESSRMAKEAEENTHEVMTDIFLEQ